MGLSILSAVLLQADIQFQSGRSPLSPAVKMPRDDVTFLLIHEYTFLPFLIINVEKPILGREISTLFLPQTPVYLQGKERYYQPISTIIRAVPEYDYLVVEPMDPVAWMPNELEGSFDPQPYLDAIERSKKGALERVLKGGGYWFSIERVPGIDEEVRKEDYIILAQLAPGFTNETVQDRTAIQGLTLVRRAEDFEGVTPPHRSRIEAIPSPLLGLPIATQSPAKSS